jgi:hypothetical protein
MDALDFMAGETTDGPSQERPGTRAHFDLADAETGRQDNVQLAPTRITTSSLLVGVRTPAKLVERGRYLLRRVDLAR